MKNWDEYDDISENGDNEDAKEEKIIFQLIKYPQLNLDGWFFFIHHKKLKNLKLVNLKNTIKIIFWLNIK